MAYAYQEALPLVPAYPGIAALGTTVLDTEPDGEAAREIRALADEVKQLLS
jgi:chromosome partitioning protein